MFSSSLRRRRTEAALMLAGLGIVLAGVGCASQGADGGAAKGALQVEAIDFGQTGAVAVPESVNVDAAVAQFAAPISMPLLEVITTAPSADALGELADRLGVGSTRKMAPREGVFALSDGTYELEVIRPDDINCFTMVASRFADGRYEEQVQGLASGFLPNETEARAVADKILNESGLSTGLFYVGAQAKTGYRVVSSSGTVETIPTSLGVTYRPLTAGGETVEGPGAKVIVVLGAEGELLSLMHWTQQTKLGGMIPLRSVADALQDIRAGLGAPPADVPQNVRLESVRMAYWAEPLPHRSSAWKPVFVFTVADADDSAASAPALEWVVSALTGG